MTHPRTSIAQIVSPRATGRLTRSVWLMVFALLAGLLGIVGAAPANAAGAGSISGTVTGQSAAGLTRISVVLYSSSGQWVASTSTSSDGGYFLDGLAAGNYKIRFEIYDNQNYLDEWWNNKATLELADTITLADGAALTGKDVELATAASISGNVKGAPNTNLAGVSVSAITLDGTYGGAASTDSNGDFQIIRVPTGSYTLDYQVPFGQNYLGEWFNDKPSQATADYFPVTAGKTVAGKNAILAVGATVSGTVTGYPNVTLTDASVALFDRDSPNFVTLTNADSGGNFTLVGVPPGSYTVQYNAYGSQNFAPEWWNDKLSRAAADYFTVGSGAITGKDAILAVGATISGNVKLEGAPSTNAEGVLVSACPTATTQYSGDCASLSVTDSDGNYTISKLAAGQYKLRFRAQAGLFPTEWWSNQNSFDAASWITVGAGATVVGKDALVGGESTISGQLLDVNGAPIPPFRTGSVYTAPAVIVYDASTGATGKGSEVYNGWVPQNGAVASQFTIPGLGVGSYKVQFLMESTGSSIPSPNPASDWVPQWYDGAYSYGAAQMITISATGSAITGVNGVLHNPRFADVSEPSSAFYSSIEWMGSSGISTGTAQPSGKPLYKPGDVVSRQAMATFMYRMSGEIFSPPGTPTFADVNSGSPLYTAIEWMTSKGISTGTAQPSGKPLFKPADPVSRQSMALFVARYAGANLSTPPTTQRFADVPLEASTATAIDWMFVNGISTGTVQPSGLPLYKPMDPVSRQAMAAFLYRVAHRP